MEIINECPMCAGSNFLLLFEGFDRLHLNPGLFCLIRCNDCKTVLLKNRPSPDELQMYYPQDYISYANSIDEQTWFQRIDRAHGIEKRYREIIKRINRIGKILDIGCGTGIFLEQMRSHGWEVYGVEPSQFAANYAKEHLGLDIINGYLNDAKYPSDHYDVVTLWDVFEHVPNPGEILGEIHRILKPGGWIVLGLPNPESWEARWFGKYWSGWDIPRHFQLPTIKYLSIFLERKNFIVHDFTSFTGRHGVMYLNFLFLSRDINMPIGLKKILLEFIRSIPMRVIFHPYYLIAEKLNKSSNISIFAQKK